uniref:Uncharacterized protein n=1 Tax=Arundo donax TaxID=35708 RepID=A0A0A8ZIL1_ARUDO
MGVLIWSNYSSRMELWMAISTGFGGQARGCKIYLGSNFSTIQTISEVI